MKIEFFKDDLIDSIGAGIYEIIIDNKGQEQISYIGESVWVIVRCATHLYKFIKQPKYLGFENINFYDDGIVLKFKVFENVSDMKTRKAREKEIIKEKKPILQNGISDRMKSVEDRIEVMRQFLESN